MHNSVPSFQVLTQDLAHRSHEDQARMACEAGVKWIQLRVKARPYDEWLEIAKATKRICAHHQATLIVNDSIEIAREVDAQGVHLGQEDSSPVDARKRLGSGKIIGHSTHSLEELIAAKDLDVDYFGLGPLRFTPTKQNLNSVLGLEEMKLIIRQARSNGITKPIIAIGGIQLADVRPLLYAGASGVAVSSVIHLDADPVSAAKNFIIEIQSVRKGIHNS